MARVNILDPTFTDPQLEDVRSGDIFLSNIPGAKGFEDILDRQGSVLQRGFKSFQDTFRSVLPSRPSDADLAGIQTFTERDRTRLRESAFTGFGGDPYRDIETEFLENFASRRNDLINNIGRGHFTWRSLPNQPKEIQEFVAKTVAQAEAKGLEQAKQIQKAQQKDLERQLTEFDRQQGRVEAQRKKTDKEFKSKEKAEKDAADEVLKLQGKLTSKQLSEGVFNQDQPSLDLEKRIKNRLTVLRKEFPKAFGDETLPKLDTSTPAGKARAETLTERRGAFTEVRQRPVEQAIERIQPTEGTAPQDRAKKLIALRRARNELINSGALDGLSRAQASAAVTQRAEEILRGLGF